MARNWNGEIIRQFLKSVEVPVTSAVIARYVAGLLGVEREYMKKSVEATLKGGLRYGYLQRKNNKYYLTPKLRVESESDSDDENTDRGRPRRPSKQKRKRSNSYRSRSRRR